MPHDQTIVNRDPMSLPTFEEIREEMRDDEILREQRASDARVIAENADLTPLRTYRAPISVRQADGHSDADIFAPTVAEVEAIVCELDADPRKIAERILRLERALADLRTQFDAATVGAYR